MPKLIAIWHCYVTRVISLKLSRRDLKPAALFADFKHSTVAIPLNQTYFFDMYL